ncbi:MAG: hypothetical protein M3256_15610 [Actinomycetota bacterium]|nr:hypothetical protein [Actinomycetota bacterium]
MKIRQKATLSTLVLAGVLVFASAAYACTTVKGTTTVTPTSAAHGTSVSMSVSATGAQASTRFTAYYLNPSSEHDSMGTCMPAIQYPDPTKIAGPTTSSSTGVISKVTNSSFNVGAAGTAWVCFIDSDTNGVPLYNYATNKAAVTVT